MPKISQYPPMTTLTGAEILVGDQAGVTSTATGTQLQALIQLTASVVVSLGLDAVDSGAVNAYVLTSPKPPAALNSGQVVLFTPLVTSTGAVTLNYNGHGAIAVLGWGGAAMTGGELSSIGPALLQYTGAAWQLISTVGAQPGYQRTPAETTAGIMPVNFAYLPPDIRRYGASLTASAGTNTTAIQNAQLANFGVIYAPPGTFAYTSASVTNCAAYGLNALSKNGTGGTPGNNNTAFGTQALAALSGGVTNPTGSTAMGYLALAASNGATNTAIGDVCMASDLTGTDNTAVGAQALFSETNSTGNNCFGFQCGYFITTGNANCLFGNYAGGGINGPTGVGITTGTANCGFGGSTLANVTTAGGNSAFGTGALGNTTGGANVAIGNFAGNHANSSNEFYLDNQDRGTSAAEVANAPIYGNFGAAAANNRLRFNAQLYASVGNLSSFNVAPTLASAAAIAPTAMITFISGTAAIATISVPFWMAGGSRITLIPIGVFTWTAASNIALAGTAVVGKALDFIYDSGTGKWYPSYIA